MVKRLISGVVGGALLLGIVFLGNQFYAFSLLIGFLVTMASLEYANLLKKQAISPRVGTMLALSLTMIMTIHILLSRTEVDVFRIFPLAEQVLLLIIVISFFVSFGRALLKKERVNGLVNAAANFLGTVYIGLMFAYILLLRFLPGVDGLNYVLFIFFVIWVNDSLAYFTGRAFGKHKLCPSISPKKTIEGSVGGIIGGTLMAVILSYYWQKPLLPMFFLGLLVSVAGQFGDLVESIIKRNAAVKDSGFFLPGHGGVLDRFDSLLFAAPVVYYYVQMFLL